MKAIILNKKFFEDVSGRWSEIILELLPDFSDAVANKPKFVPCPIHGGKDGFRFFDDFDKTGGGVCNTCGFFWNGVKLIARAKPCSINDAYAMVKDFLAKAPPRRNIKTKKKDKLAKLDSKKVKNQFNQIVSGFEDGSNKIIPSYFGSRGLKVSVPPWSQIHPNLRYYENQEGSYKTFPAMVFPFMKGLDLVGLHVTYLAPDGSAKAPVKDPKKTINKFENGSLSGAVIPLTDLDETGKLILSEGIETALACHQATGWPAWACGNTSLMKTAILPNEVSEVYIAADLDLSGAGLAAAETLAQRLLSDGKKVFVVIPPGPILEGKKSQDWLDELSTNGVDIVRNHFEETKEMLPDDLQNKLVVNSNELVKKYGLDDMDCSTSLEEIQRRMMLYVVDTKSLPDLQRHLAKSHLIEILKERRIQAPTQTANDLYGEGGLAGETLQGEELVFYEPEPWPEGVDGGLLLDELTNIFKKFLILPPGAAETMALWTIFTWSIDAFYIAPNLIFQSPEKRCGKTTALSILDCLCSKPIPSSNISPAALFRSIEKYRPTLLIDEADRGLKFSEEINLIINSSHNRSAAFALRSTGEDNEPRKFKTWCPKVIAAIGRLHGTLEDRSIIILMKRKKKGESVQRFKVKHVYEGTESLKRKILRWVKDHFEILSSSSPELPDSINDRAQDNWEPLLAIADAVGGEWPSKVRKIITTHFNGDEKESSFGVQLLEDINLIFKKLKKEKISTVTLLAKLVLNEDRPWGEFGRERKPLTARRLSELLKPYGIGPTRWKDNRDKTVRGYKNTQFKEAWERYI